MSVELTDREVAVLIDSLAETRKMVREAGYPTPNIDSALDKIKSLMTPATVGLRIEAVSL
jgi:hypothetical protein